MLADPNAINAAIEQQGLRVHVEFKPAPPASVRKVLGYVCWSTDDDRDCKSDNDGGIDQIRLEYKKEERPFGNLVRKRIPRDYDSKMTLVIGRRPQPGEDTQQIDITPSR